MKKVIAFLAAFLVFLTLSPVSARGNEDINEGRFLERIKLATPSADDEDEDEADEVEPRLEILRKREEEREEEREEHKEELRTKLQAIKDENKQKVVEKLDERLSMMNENWTQHWNNVLERLNQILDKIEARAEKLGEQGKDTAAVTQQINYAQAAIDTAQSAVDAQAEKEYTFEITEETQVREEVKVTIAQFKADTRKVLDSIKSARENVRLALIQVGQLTGERVEVEEEE
jgi:DNA-binding FrmR family transcriptional regulator